MAGICRFLVVICGSWWSSAVPGGYLSVTRSPIELFWTAKKIKSIAGFVPLTLLYVTVNRLVKLKEQTQVVVPMTLLYVILFLTGVLGNLAVCLVIVRYLMFCCHIEL